MATFSETERRVSVLGAVVIGICLGLLPMVVVNVPWMQSHVFVADDRDLGLALHEPPPAKRASGDPQAADENGARIARCQRYALKLYDHPIPADEVKPFPGWATPAEKAFYRACVEGR
ncbi:MAG: hypothetical protein QM714_08895 [Nocardioides sp.]|uniref:hypothetical protein n=1 Tax=Nocardioides sp. TaxID=35761 RepID=UPI0039E264C4